MKLSVRAAVCGPLADRSIADGFGSKLKIPQILPRLAVQKTAAKLFGAPIVVEKSSIHGLAPKLTLEAGRIRLGWPSDTEIAVQLRGLMFLPGQAGPYLALHFISFLGDAVRRDG